MHRQNIETWCNIIKIYFIVTFLSWFWWWWWWLWWWWWWWWWEWWWLWWWWWWEWRIGKNLGEIVSWISVQCQLSNWDEREIGVRPDLAKTFLSFQLHSDSDSFCSHRVWIGHIGSLDLPKTLLSFQIHSDSDLNFTPAKNTFEVH